MPRTHCSHLQLRPDDVKQPPATDSSHRRLPENSATFTTHIDASWNTICSDVSHLPHLRGRNHLLNGNAMKTLAICAAAILTIASVGCDESALDREADAVRDNTQQGAEDIRDSSQNAAENLRDRTDNAAESVQDAAERKADAIEDRGEMNADTLEERGENKADALEEVDVE